MYIKTKEEFDGIVEMIRSNVEFYKKYMTEIHYKLFLANAKSIDITYDRNRIPHLLGLNLDYIRGLGVYHEKSAFELLEAFLYDSYSAYRKADSVGAIFSDHVIDKNNIFKDNLKIQLSDISCVIDYKKDRIYGHTTVECPCDCYILKKTKDADELLILGLSRSSGGYAPQTSQLFRLSNLKDKETLESMFYHQHITFCNSINYSNSYESDVKKFFLPLLLKSDAMVELNRYAAKYDAVIAVHGDYSHILKKLNEISLNESKKKTTIQAISNMMRTGELIDIELLDDDISSDLVELIQSYNDSHFVENNDSSMRYTDLLGQYQELKAMVETLQQERNQMEEQLNKQHDELELLKSQNSEYKETAEKILKLLKTRG